jgi:hypothetical protein
MKFSTPKMLLGFIAYGLEWTAFFQLGVNKVVENTTRLSIENHHNALPFSKTQEIEEIHSILLNRTYTFWPFGRVKD